MRKHSTYTKAMWMALVVLSIGCSGTSTTQQTDPTLVDGDATQTQLGMVLRSGSQSFVQNALITSDNLALTTATACVEKIELKLPYGLSCSDVGFVTQSGLICEEEMDEEHGQMVLESKIKAYGPFTINMLDGSSQPSLENVQIPSGTYQEIEFEFRDDCGLGDEISMILEGTALHGDSESFPFRMELDYDDDLEIESTIEVSVIENQVNQTFATLDVNRWFENADWIGCIADGHIAANGSGVYVINENTDASGNCDDIYDDILDGIEDALEFEDHGSDDDHSSHSSDDDDDDDDDSNDD